MVATTATQGLRYPQVGDSPCDLDLHMGYLASDIEAKLNSHDDDLARTLLPPAFIASGTPALYLLDAGTGTAAIQMDAVQHQVGGEFVNLAANPKLFHVPRLGTYQMSLEIEFNATVDDNGAEYQVYLARYPNTSLQVQGQHVNKVEGFEFMTVTGLVRVTSLAHSFLWMMIPAGNNFLLSTIQLTDAKISAFWVSD